VHSRSVLSRRYRCTVVAAATALATAGGFVAAPAFASSVTSAAFSGGSGTVGVGGTLYARNGGALTLTVSTSADTQCVDVSGALTGHQQSTTAKSAWTFTFTAGTGDGTQAVTVAAAPGVNPQDKCTGTTGTAQASYLLDNTGPVVTAALSPAPNAAGWNNGNVGIAWAASDAGSGVGGGPTPATDSQNSNTPVTGTTHASTATDRLGNAGSGSVTVKLDKTVPTISGSRSPAANADGWSNTDVTASFTCSDALSGIKSCPGATTLSSNGANQSVTGTALDNADNSAAATVSSISIDKTPPTLTGSPTTAPNAAGWYGSNVTIHWTASDTLSGLTGAAPADSMISTEGTGLTAGASISDKAGNTTNAASSPAVAIDKTAPNTTATAPANWNNTDVTVSLAGADALSGIEATHYRLDGAGPETGTSVGISTEGLHSLQFWSVDKAGNVEAAKTVQVRIDRTSPTINHTLSPAANGNGWNDTTVTVTFTCADALSGIASCTGPQTVTNEGRDQPVPGTATDNAGNTAADPASVSVDRTPPTIFAAADRPANGNGWYHDDVTVPFRCADALSGIDTCPVATTLGEGANQSATGTTTDAAGNTAGVGLAGIDVDTTPPALTANFPTGWHTGDLTVAWTCTDGLSGVVAQPATDTVTGEGDNLSSTASCIDRAGNTAVQTASGIEIDRTPPTTTAAVPAPLPSGWYAGQVSVSLTGHDALSGVAATSYRVDGGPAQSYAGPFSFGVKGEHTISFWSVDNAGNVQDSTGSITLRIDGNPPATSVINPISPASGWFVTSGIPVAFAAGDAESGIAATYYTIDGGAAQVYGDPFTASLGTRSHTISFWSVDNAGNVEAAQAALVRVDTVPPTILGSPSPGPNANGWNNADVTVTFTCSDADSGVNGVVGCGPDYTVGSQGGNQYVQGDAQDIAGNASHATVGPINIDKTVPTLNGAATTDPNGAGWYRGDVSIHWTADDGLSGIDTGTQPADSVITGEGGSLAASAGVYDKAGNKGVGSVGGIKIDRTPPVISGAPATSPNPAGWYTGDVVVGFSCTDNLSGVAACPTDKMLSTDGTNLSVTSDPATDRADNSAPGRTVGGINIDGHVPQTTADNQCTATNGYCTGSTATVVLTAADVGPSGVKEIHYSVSGGAEQAAAGATVTVTVPLSGGAASVRYWAIDRAGNAEPANTAAIKYDNIAPTVTHTVTPAPNAAGWNNSNPTVHFGATDNDPSSGLASVTPDVAVGTETAGQVVTGQATDTAGNVGTDSVTVRLDKTKPAVSGAVTSGSQGASGWYVGPVTVHFTCSDALSGVAVCPDDYTFTDNGSNQAITRSATDMAGNSASVTVGGISIDQEKPTITSVNVVNGFYLLGAVPAPTCTADDTFSGPPTCAVTVSGGKANGVGTFTYTATATDKAGNMATQTGSYRVVYRWDGFLQPINDTAHQTGQSISVFKAGSTVPAKFQLKRSDGTVVQANTAPVSPVPAKGVSMSMAVDEAAYGDPADTGSAYRWDSVGQQYIYNWKSGTGGNYWRIGVALDDGQAYYVNIGLR